MAWTGSDDPERPKLVEPAPGVFVRQEVDNIGWTDTGEGLVVVDALERPELEGEVLDLLAATAPGRPVRWVVNTHTHYDHIALNAAFERRYGAEIVNLRTRRIPAAGWRVPGARRAVEVIPMPGCHTAEDCIVWLPDDRVLFVGDIFGWGLIPWDAPLSREKLDHILATYDALIRLGPEHVAPGHGPLCSVRELQRWMEYVRWVVEDVKSLVERGISPSDITADLVPPPEDMHGWWRFLQWKHEDTLKKIAHAVRRGRL